MSEVLRAEQVFTPTKFPTYTYVTRDNQRMERRLENALSTPGTMAAISGPTKSGKTVLLKKVAGLANVVEVSCASITTADELWEHALDELMTPHEGGAKVMKSAGGGGTLGGKGGIGIPFVASGEMNAQANITGSYAREQGSLFKRRGIRDVVALMKSTKQVLLVDDFHYLASDVLRQVSLHLKEAIGQEVKIAVASVAHRGGDAVRSNPDLQGRFMAVELSYWTNVELLLIVEQGLRNMNATLDGPSMADFVTECFGSPQLMQLICLETCRQQGLNETSDFPFQISLSAVERTDIYREVVAQCDFKPQVAVMTAGPRTRGQQRTKLFVHRDGKRLDAYATIVRALRLSPAKPLLPKLDIYIDDLMGRLGTLCIEPPTTGEVEDACTKMCNAVLKSFPELRLVEWTDRTFYILDPYLLFYLRWSDPQFV